LFVPNTPNRFQEWLFAKDPRRDTVALNIATIRFLSLSSSVDPSSLDQPAGEKHLLSFFLSPDREEIHYRSTPTDAEPQQGTVQPGQEFDPGWGGIMVRLEEFFPQAKRTEKIVEAGSHAAGRHNSPVAHVQVEKNQKMQEGYVVYNSEKTFNLAGDRITIYFGQQRVPIGFTLRLLDFRAPRYPGTNRPASYESDVMLLDPANNVERQQRIYMNNPLYYNDFVVFQSSYIEGRGNQPDISIFSVAKAPGTPVIYFGSTIMIAGMIVIIYQKSRKKESTQHPSEGASS
jgi:hypothetical protein